MWPWNLKDSLEKQHAEHIFHAHWICVSIHSHLCIHIGSHPETLKSEPNRLFSTRETLKFGRRPRITIRHLFYAVSTFEHNFVTIRVWKLELQSGKSHFRSKSSIFRPMRRTFKFDCWPKQTIGHLFSATWSLCIISQPFVHLHWNSDAQMPS